MSIKSSENKNKKIGIFIFRRDLRLNDNLGLIRLQNEVDIIIPIFILDKYQIKKSSHNSNYFSNNAVQFMCESLTDLNQSLLKYDSYLRLYYGNYKKIINKLIKWTISDLKTNPSDIYLSFNADFSLYAIERDNLIKNICDKHKINFFTSENDFTLIPFEQMIKSDKTGFKQYGAFYKNAIKHVVNKPIRTNYNSSINIFTLGEIADQIKSTQKFKSYLEHLKKQESRATVLGTCVYSDFYNLCTEEELAYLGW